MLHNSLVGLHDSQTARTFSGNFVVSKDARSLGNLAINFLSSKAQVLLLY